MGYTPQQQRTDSAASSETLDEKESPGLDRDELFHVLRNRRRRFAIHYLKRASVPVDVSEIATQVAAWENGVSVEEVTSKQRRSVYNALKQTHIPELVETRLVEEDRGEIELTERSKQLDIYLELVPEKDLQWSEYYLGLGAVGLTVLVLTWIGFGPFAYLPAAAPGVFLAVALVVSAAAHYYYQHRSLLGSSEKPPELRGG